jgi:hypothetical protein
MENAARDCKHGRLASSCDQRADETEIAELRAYVSVLRDVAQMVIDEYPLISAGGNSARLIDAARRALSASAPPLPKPKEPSHDRA